MKESAARLESTSHSGTTIFHRPSSRAGDVEADGQKRGHELLASEDDVATGRGRGGVGGGTVHMAEG